MWYDVTMYTNKEKQREANRKAQAKRRGMTEGMTESVAVAPTGMTGYDITGPKTPEELRGMTYEEHNRRSWALAAKMKREEPERFEAIVGAVVQKGMGDSVRWGCFGPTYTELTRR